MNHRWNDGYPKGLGDARYRRIYDAVNAEAAIPLADLARDERCVRCATEGVNWVAPSPLWNLVMRGGDINGEPAYHDLVCMKCFVDLAHRFELSGQWRLYLHPEPEGLVKVTPSGRTWDPEAWLWREHL